MRKLPKRSAVTTSFAVLFLLSFYGGCKDKVEHTETAGVATVVASESIASLMKSEADDFHRIYPTVTIHILPAPTREAFVQFLNDSVPAIAVDRPMNEEERYVVATAGLKVVENQIGSDAVVVLVPRSNPVPALTLSSLRDILSGRINRWEKVPGSASQGRIRLVLTGRNSGLYEILTRNYSSPDSAPQPSVLAGTQEEIIRTVERDRLSIGMILFSAYDSYRKNTAASGLRVIPFALPDTTVQPTQQAIYTGTYPLSLPLYFYTREEKGRTASGFATFIRSLEGQKLIQNAGIVPVTIPSRTIQITQE